MDIIGKLMFILASSRHASNWIESPALAVVAPTAVDEPHTPSSPCTRRSLFLERCFSG